MIIGVEKALLYCCSTCVALGRNLEREGATDAWRLIYEMGAV